MRACMRACVRKAVREHMPSGSMKRNCCSWKKMFIYLCVLHFHMLLVMLHYLMIKLNNMKPKMFDEMGMPAATSCVK